MTDVILVAVIVAFFVAGALLVRGLDRVVAGSGSDAERDDETPGPNGGPPA